MTKQKSASDRLNGWLNAEPDIAIDYTAGSRAFAEDVIEILEQHSEMLAMLNETVLQLQYLADKFGETGTGAAVLTRVQAVIAKATGVQS